MISKEKLRMLGLSKAEVLVYRSLLAGGRYTVKELANDTGIRNEVMYPIIKRLKKKGLIITFGRYPIVVQSLPLEVGLNNLNQKLQQLTNAILKYKIGTVDLLPFKFIKSRKDYHLLGEELFAKSKKEVLVIASGTGDLPADFIKTKVDSVKSGVTYNILATKREKTNKRLIENWIRNGFKVRFKEGKDINLVVYDRELIQIGFRLKEGSKDKVGLLIKNRSLAEFLAEFYDYLWEKSGKIN